MRIETFVLSGLLAAVVMPSVSDAATLANGRQMNGFTLNGFTLNGFTLNGLNVNGLKWNGLTLNGIEVSTVCAVSEKSARATHERSSLNVDRFPLDRVVVTLPSR